MTVSASIFFSSQTQNHLASSCISRWWDPFSFRMVCRSDRKLIFSLRKHWCKSKILVANAYKTNIIIVLFRVLSLEKCCKTIIGLHWQILFNSINEWRPIANCQTAGEYRWCLFLIEKWEKWSIMMMMIDWFFLLVLHWHIIHFNLNMFSVYPSRRTFK